VERPAPGTVDLWQVALDVPAGLADELAALLSPDEIRAARALSNRKLRQRAVVARAARRRILAAYLGCPPHELRYVVAERGKPAIAGDGALHFNASRSESVALVAVAAMPVGVDVERCAPFAELDAVARTVLSQAEWRRWRMLPSGRRVDDFYRSWARKEAYVKGTGRGIGDGLGDVPADPPPGWSITDLALAPGWAAALATQAAPATVKRLAWQPTG
jgi:4'-phosphopantetheinyl transferase